MKKTKKPKNGVEFIRLVLEQEKDPFRDSLDIDVYWYELKAKYQSFTLDDLKKIGTRDRLTFLLRYYHFNNHDGFWNDDDFSAHTGVLDEECQLFAEFEDVLFFPIDKIKNLLFVSAISNNTDTKLFIDGYKLRLKLLKSGIKKVEQFKQKLMAAGVMK